MVVIPNEVRDGETRVALTPDLVRRLGNKVEVVIERGAGHAAGFPDDAYRDAGARVESDAAALWSNGDVVATVGAPDPAQIASMKPGTVLLGLVRPVMRPDVARACLQRGVTLLSLDFVPRITRAQTVDALSAMATVAGYKAVILGAAALPKMFPMLMTAAGTVAASKVFVIGAGVAGLQAIATARRLGATVEAYDVRPAVREQVESLGARFVEFQIDAAEGRGGYAAELTAEQQAQQRRQMAAAVAGADLVITTAAVPNRPAPKLIDEDMVRGMRPGSVIVDLAAESGGNCTLTRPGQTVVAHDVTILGPDKLPASVPHHASQMYGRVIFNVLGLILKDGGVSLDFDDEVVSGLAVVHEGQARSEALRERLAETSPA